MITGQTLPLIALAIALIVLFIWGPKKIPEWVKSIAKAKYYYEKAKRGEYPEEPEKKNTSQNP